MKKLSELLKYRNLVILDSAMGTELQRRDEDVSLPLWSANAVINNPDMVRQIHIDNIDAGADMITANTFRTQRRTLQKANFTYEGLDHIASSIRLTRIAVDLAKDAVLITDEKVLVAGSIAPLEDCYRPELVPSTENLLEEHQEQYNILEQSGVDFLLAETMSTVKEISSILESVSSKNKEYCISLLCRDENRLFSGESIEVAVGIINKYSPVALLVNCIHPSRVEPVIKNLKKLTSLPLGAYANIGKPDYTDGNEFVRTVSVKQYYHYAKGWKKLGVRIIGGCCGTTPEYIKKISILKD
jgi:S-methylmethionine-dependent homocysteine/selenocysteine methylase